MSLTNITFTPSTTTPLTHKVTQVLCCYANGHLTKESCEILHRSHGTIRTQLYTAREHYNAKNTVHAVALAIASGHIKYTAEPVTVTTKKASRPIALTFALLAGLVAIQDTPFISDADNELVRNTRQLRSQSGKSNRRELSLNPFFM